MSEIILLNDVNGQLGFGRYAGPYRLATELRVAGFQVQVIEFFADLDLIELKKLVDAHVDSKTLFVGFSTTLWTKHQTKKDSEKLWLDTPSSGIVPLLSVQTEMFPHDDDVTAEFIENIKIKNNNTKIVVGGAKALGKKFGGVDYWVLGQGEESILAIARHLKFGNGLKCIDTDYGKVLTDKIHPYNNFSCSKIQWHADDHLFTGEHLPIETARGCIFKCSFCAYNLNGKKFGDYNKAASTLREEFIYNYENFGTTHYMICDDTMNDSLDKVKQLHSVIVSLPFKITMSGYIRLDVLASQPEMEDLFLEMGVVSVNCGIETFHREAGRHIGKGADPNMLKEKLYQLKEKWKDNIYVSVNFVVGLPYETVESVRETFEWLYRDDCPVSTVGMNRLIPRVYFPTIQSNNMSNAEMINYGFVKVPAPNEGWQYSTASKLTLDPMKYGIEMNPNNKYDWKSPWMNRDIVIELINEFHADSRGRQKFGLTAYHSYNRMLNIGYKHEDLTSLFLDDKKVIKEGITRRYNLKQQYLKKIL
jgi:hypothetical protein